MPSFVSTLAGLLAVLGLQLYILGSTGSINLPYGSPLVNFGQTAGHAAWRLLRARRCCPASSILVTGLRTRRAAQAAGLSAPVARRRSCAQRAVITVVLELVVVYLNHGRGVPWMFGLFVGARRRR